MQQMRVQQDPSQSVSMCCSVFGVLQCSAANVNAAGPPLGFAKFLEYRALLIEHRVVLIDIRVV